MIVTRNHRSAVVSVCNNIHKKKHISLGNYKGIQQQVPSTLINCCKTPLCSYLSLQHISMHNYTPTGPFVSH